MSTTRLRESVQMKRFQLQLQRENLKLAAILRGQVIDDCIDTIIVFLAVLLIYFISSLFISFSGIFVIGKLEGCQSLLISYLFIYQLLLVDILLSEVKVAHAVIFLFLLIRICLSTADDLLGAMAFH